MTNETTYTWTVYRHESFFSPECPQTKRLIADDLGNGWTAIYHRKGVWRGKLYPANIIGLCQSPLGQASLDAIRAKRENETDETWEQMIRDSLGLLDALNPAVPPAQACVGMPFKMGLL